jgi:polyphosphate:AMP phosphotransferase
LRESLLRVQHDLRTTARSSALIVLTGVDAAGRGESANVLNQWMDPRWIVTRAWREPPDEERERPEYWRYWRTLPARGRIGLLINAWYEPVVQDRLERQCGKTAFATRLEQIAIFEKALADDGAIILKFFLYLDAKSQRKRLKAFKKNPLTRWRVTEREWRALRRHGRVTAVAEEAIRHTSTDATPWHVVEGIDANYRNFMVGTLIHDALREGMDRASADGSRVVVKRRPRKAGYVAKTGQRNAVLRSLDMTQAIEKKLFRYAHEKQQGRLHRLVRRARERGVSMVAVFEGWDAAGKGSALRRVTGALDARDYHVIPIAAPTDEERAHHLWRFWRHLSRAGEVTIFDRSWYGRVLVERVEGFATLDEYQRGYSEINHFEKQLVERGIVLVKFWLHITKDEQLRRFRERQRTARKRWKITDEDWRNRRRWNDYEQAVTEMVSRTSMRRAPWVLVEANDKYFARIKVLRTLADRLQRVLKR